MRKSLICLVLLLLSQPFAAGQESDDAWQDHAQKAERAYASHNLFEARREFLIALKEARECNEHEALASRVECFASSYKSSNKAFLAEPLLKLARKLRTKCTTT